MKQFDPLSIEGFDAFEQHFQELGLEFLSASFLRPGVFVLKVEMAKGVFFEFSYGHLSDNACTIRHEKSLLCWPTGGLDGLSSLWNNDDRGTAVGRQLSASFEDFFVFLEKFAKERSDL